VFSPQAAEHVQRPRNIGPIESASHIGLVGIPGEGAFVKIWLRLENGKILQSAYQTHGCPSSVAAASLLCQLAVGKDVKWVNALRAQDLLVILGGLPEGKEKFASMAVSALQNAVSSKLIMEKG